MKKYLIVPVLLSFVGLVALADNNKSELSRAPKPAVNLSAETMVCVQNAIDKRDSAIISAVDKFSSSVKTSLSTRKDALKAAWSKSTKVEIRLALKEAWSVYGKSLKDTRATLKRDKKTAWNQYKVDSRACKAPVEDKKNEGADAQL